MARKEVEAKLEQCRCGEKPIVVPAGPTIEANVIAMCAACQNSTGLSTLSEVGANWQKIAKGYGSTLRGGF